MGPVKSRIWIFVAVVAVGAVTMLLLHLHFVMFWESSYSGFEWRGYEGCIVHGRCPPFFSGTSRSLLITNLVLFFLPLVVFWFARERPWTSTLGLWLGVMLSVVIIWLATKRLREDSNMWPISLVFLSFMTAFPLLLGCVIADFLSKDTRDSEAAAHSDRKIRDSQRQMSSARPVVDSEPRGLCPNCETEIALNSLECPKCKAQFGPNSAWNVKPL